MRKIGEVWVQIPSGEIKEPFTYEIPEKYHFITPGWRVLVPWGRRLIDGVVLSISQISEDEELPYSLKPIQNIFEESAFYSEKDIQLANWISKTYFCSIGDALRLFIPGGKEGKEESYFVLNSEWVLDENLSPEEKNLLSWIKGHQPFSQNQLKQSFPLFDSAFISRWVKEKKLIQTRKYKRISKIREVIYYKITESGARVFREKNSRGTSQIKLLEQLSCNELVERKRLIERGISSSVLKNAIEKDWIEEQRVLENQIQSSLKEAPSFPLTDAQKKALEEIQLAQNENKYKEFLLLGITGSGKTEIYIRTAEFAQSQGKGTIMLVPEIALTSQLVYRFQEHFGSSIVVFHSSISLGEKRTAWARVQSGEATIVIGTRSALFAPIKNLGAIILDEEHEFTYKQEDFPKYHARDIARKRAELEEAVFILGSATPSLESYYRAKTNKSQLLILPERIGNRPLPSVEIVDMREELKKGNKTILSSAMHQLISEALIKKEQLILLMNRRGYSTFVICRECGYVAQCPDCHVSLVYHQKTNTMECHYCHFHQSVPEICPSCGSSYIRFFGSGTEKVEEIVRLCYPNAVIERMDKDTTSRKGSGEQILKRFRQGKIDILIGTQMVAKGHDIPNVTAIGIISADTVLHIPDFRASEQTFSLLTQVAGRAGRGKIPGHVVIQTYSPEEPSILDAAKQDYYDFAERELEERKIFDNPPYSYLFKCTMYKNNELELQELNQELLEELADDSKINELLGPYPEKPLFHRASGKWYQHILIKTKSPEELTLFLSSLKEKYDSSLRINRDPLRIF